MSLPSAPHDEYVSQILQAIDENDSVSQRTLSKDLGIALGLTNLLVRRLVGRGLVRVRRIRRDRVRYLLTPAGVVEKARMSRRILAKAVDRYGQARRRLGEAFGLLSARWPDGPSARRKRIVVFGTGEFAEIGFICLQETDLELAGVIDDSGRQRFFGLPVHAEGELGSDLLDQLDARVLVILSLRDPESVEGLLKRARIPASQVVWP